MPKIIAPAFPIEEIRGKLAGSQQLEYAENNNAAYDSPLGKRNYARNYKTCLVACKRASDGKQYFQIKTKSAIGMTVKSKKRMALLGGAGAVYAAITRNPDVMLRLQAAYGYEKSVGATTAKTLRAFVTNEVMKGLSRKMQTVFTARESMSQTLVINNPWVPGGSAENVDLTTFITQESLVKFWSELAVNGHVMVVNTEAYGEQDVLISGNDVTFAQRAAASYNDYKHGMIVIANGYAALSMPFEDDLTYKEFIKDFAGAYCADDETIDPSAVYSSTATAPQA